jgi:hypothetical protein
MRLLTRLIAPAIAFVALGSSFAAAGQAPQAQQHIVAPSELSSTVAEHVAAKEADRAAIREALSRPEVQSVISQMGVTEERVNNTVDTMDGADLAKAGDTARKVNEQLVGGASTVVISTTTIILILLLIIIIILVAR